MAAGSRCVLLVSVLAVEMYCSLRAREIIFWKREGIRRLPGHHKGKWRERQALMRDGATALFYFDNSYLLAHMNSRLRRFKNSLTVLVRRVPPI
jgi:hypothetical protein